MSRGRDGDDPFEDEEYQRRLAQERADRAREKARVTINIHHQPPPAAPGLYPSHLLMACLQCGQQMLRGGQCRRCGAWCR